MKMSRYNVTEEKLQKITEKTDTKTNLFTFLSHIYDVLSHNCDYLSNNSDFLFHICDFYLIIMTFFLSSQSFFHWWASASIPLQIILK